MACSVDDRQLGPAGSGGITGNGFGGSPTVDGGEAGAGEPEPLPVCDYGNGVPEGCDSLVANPGLARNTRGWSAEDATVVVSWSEHDANAHKESGAVSVLNTLFGAANGIASRAATQCLPTVPGQAYGFALDVFVPEGQGEALDGGTYTANAGLGVIFYTSSQCDGYSLGSASSALAEEPGVWTHREGRAIAPQGAQSMLVRLVALKNFREYSFEAYFDNVFVKAE